MTKIITMVATVVMAICAALELQSKETEVTSYQPLQEVNITNIISNDSTEGVQIDNEVNNID